MSRPPPLPGMPPAEPEQQSPVAPGGSSPAPAPALAPAPDPPPAVRADSEWEFHADERVADAGFSLDGRVRVVDGLGTLSILDAAGRLAATSRLDVPVRAVSLPPSGAAAVLTEAGKLVGLDETGARRFEIAADGALAVGASSRFIALGAERHPVRVLSPAGRLRFECAVEHPVAFVAPCSPQGHVVALSASGQFSVVHGGRMLWRLHLRSNATALAACDGGLFVVAHREGAQAFTLEGSCLGLFDVGRPLRGVALASDAPVLLLLDDQDGLHRVDLSTGFSTWRETRSRSLAFVRLSRDGARALVASRAGAVEMLSFVRAADRAQRLEVVGRLAASGDGVWRHPSAVVEDLEPSARFAVDPTGSSLAVSRDEGARIEILDASGEVVGRVPGARDLAALAFSSDGSRVVIHGGRSVTHCRRDGSDRVEIAGAFSHVLPGPGDQLVLACSSPPGVRLQSGRDASGECALAGAVVHAVAAPDLSRVAVADASGTLTAWASGHAPWRRPHDARPGSLALGGPGLVACEGEDVVGLLPDGTEAWRCRTHARVELVTAGDHVFARDADNRFVRLDDAFRGHALDARPNLGRSLLIAAPSPDGVGLLEVNVNGPVLTAFTLGGRIAWRCEAPSAVNPTSVVARSGLLAFRAATLLCLLDLRTASSAADVAGRAAFLEL